ncbi:MAG: site-specific DNA-methyltransferase [Candidatus Gracilibacteria bacterium]|nr:site-specific DNA-methyltransferase [Candidatus Gracilibacteria bacterium]
MSKKDITNSPKIQETELENLKTLFPQFFSEGNFDIDGFKSYLEGQTADNNEFYRFEWTGKKNAKQIASKPTKNTLIPDIQNSKNWDTTQNLFIEGDNLEVLKLLLNKYYGQIKMIYIDPPYNKDKDFVYKDTWKDNLVDYLAQTGQVDEDGETTTEKETTGRKHSNWLNMIYPRLILARKLLKEDGVIFVSIDDDEVHNLRKVMDEVFGPDNFIAQIIVKNNPGGRDYGGIALTHEYAIVYSKNIETELNLIEDKNKKFPFKDEKGDFELRELRNRNIKFNNLNRPNLYYPFYININNIDEFGLYEISLENKPGFIELFPLESQGIKTVWRWGKDKVLKNLNLEIKGKLKNDGGYMIVEKYRSNLSRERSIFDEKDVRGEYGTLSVKNLFGKNTPFDYPKSDRLIYRFLNLGLSNNDIILDFFAGSGTTAHAVIDLNKDGGNRKFICVQLPEKVAKNSEAEKAGYKTISEITRERIKRAGEKIKSEEGGENVDIGFRAFKLAESNFKYLSEKYEIKTGLSEEENKIQMQILEENMKKEVEETGLIDGRTENDVVYELIIREGYSFYSSVEKLENGIYKVSDENKYFYALIQEKISEEDIRKFVKNHLNEKQVRFFALEESLSESARATLDTYFILQNI